MDILQGLNNAQHRAVETTNGPLLILAGPGSGKTRVIAHRIAYLVTEAGVPPYRILAVTFTNKAAKEMQERVYSLLGEPARDITLGTFHAICSRILRVDGEHIGIPRSFAIYDDDDQIVVIKQALVEMGLELKRNPPRAVLSAISRAKSELITPEAYNNQIGSYFEEIVARVYNRYQELLEVNSAVDFDDLLMKVVELFRERSDILEKYQQRYHYVHVDEFQDTNIAQYVLARQFAGGHGNICVVGDPDQSIYSWRSADIRNILNFERDFPNATVVYLEQNYRSTQTILDGAHSVISANRQRKDKKLWTEKGEGLPLVIHESMSEDDEAEFVAKEIEALARQEHYPLSACAVMYRTNAQSRPLEDVFVRHSLPYRLVGGTRFYERREVKDLLAFLRLAQNPFDSIALMRIINVPPRGIGQRSLEELSAFARRRDIPPYAALQLLGDGDEELTGLFQARVVSALQRFLEMLNGLIRDSRQLPLSRLVISIIESSGYRDYILKDERFADSIERWENIEQICTVAAQYDELDPIEGLARFLEDVALVTDIDEYDERSDAVTLITLHAAKGLEFQIVFIVGMEEGVLPHIRSFDEPAQMEEERRLCYVGMTRAKERLYLVRAFKRGFGMPAVASRFLKDVPVGLVSGRPLTSSRPVQRVAIQPAPVTNGGSSSPAFVAGDRVRHPRFGNGVVVSCQIDVHDQMVTVAFKGDAGVKKLLLSMAPLELVNR